MIQFSSKNERRYWVIALLVTGFIYASLFITQPQIEFLISGKIPEILFISGTLLTFISILYFAITRELNARERIVILLSLASIILFISRLAIADRTHVIEYSLLTIAIHMALQERNKRLPIKCVACVTIVIAFLIGISDECFQLFMQNRHFDVQDILFNTLAILIVIIANFIITRIRKSRMFNGRL